MESTSLSVRVDAGVIDHNNRIFFAKNVNPNKVKDNIIYKQEEIREAYSKLFSQALKEYNDRQTQPCRRIKDYFEKIKNSKQEKLFYETIIQFGDKDDTAVGSIRGEKAKKMLDEYMLDFQKRNPNLYVFNAVMHLDEATPHLHIDFIPIATNQKQGLSTRVSLKKALEQQGIFGKSIKESDRQQWAIKEKVIMQKIAKKYSIEVVNKNIHRQHLNDKEYKEYAQEIEKLKQYIEQLKQKPENQLTQEEINLIKNENALLQNENKKLKKQQSSKRKDFYFSSEDKLNYIVEKLQEDGIDATIEGEAVRAPEWAEERIKKLEELYKPKPTPWRDMLKFDIDRLIYAVKNIDELWESLKNKGYEIKTGKYISVKPEGAERFIRTKSLGYEYSLESLERRIASNRNFEKGCTEKINKTTGMEKDFHSAVKNIVVLFYKQNKYPNKINKDKPFTIKNDRNIAELKNCLDLINSEKIKSSVDLDNRRERCDENITGAEKRIKELNNMQDAIKDIKVKAKLYFNSKNYVKTNSMQEMRIAVAKETLDDYGIHNEADLFKADEAYEKYKQEKETLLEIIKSEKEKLSGFSKLLEIYEQTQNGEYIGKLLKLENERLGAEKKRR